MDTVSVVSLFAGSVGLILNLVAVVLLFMVPILFLKMYKRVSSILHIMKNNEAKIDSIERNLEKLAKSKEQQL